MSRSTRSLFASLVVLVAVLGGLIRPAAAQQAGVRVEDGVQYAAPGGQPLLLDIYHPAGPGPFPAVIVVHGGGWQFGDRKNLADASRYLAENGLVAFAIDYRLAAVGKNYNPYPAAVEDVRASIRWVRTHAANYDVDPSKIGLLGSSSGAHLVSLVGMEGKGPLDRGDRVKAIVSWSGPQDIVELYQDGPSRAQVGVDKFTDCRDGLPACQSIFQQVSPITYVDSSDPPLFFANGRNELVPIAGALEMDKALADAGVSRKLVQVPGSFHAQRYANLTSPMLPAGQTVQEASLEWLQLWLVRNGVGAPTPSTPSTPSRPSPPPNGSKSNLLMVLLLVAVALGVIVFATAAIMLTLRRRKRRLRREREWKQGQARYRSRSRSGRSSTSGSRSGSSSRSGSGSSSRSGSGSRSTPD